eukprot:UN23834
MKKDSLLKSIQSDDVIFNWIETQFSKDFYVTANSMKRSLKIGWSRAKKLLEQWHIKNDLEILKLQQDAELTEDEDGTIARELAKRSLRNPNNFKRHWINKRVAKEQCEFRNVWKNSHNSWTGCYRRTGGIYFTKNHKDPRVCAGYVNYWFSLYNETLPNTGVPIIVPPPQIKRRAPRRRKRKLMSEQIQNCEEEEEKQKKQKIEKIEKPQSDQSSSVPPQEPKIKQQPSPPHQPRIKIKQQPHQQISSHQQIPSHQQPRVKRQRIKQSPHQQPMMPHHHRSQQRAPILPLQPQLRVPIGSRPPPPSMPMAPLLPMAPHSIHIPMHMQHGPHM